MVIVWIKYLNDVTGKVCLLHCVLILTLIK